MSDEQQAFMDRLGITSDEFSEVAAFYGLMTGASGRRGLSERAADYGVDVAVLMDARLNANQMFIANARLLDEAARETQYQDETYIDADGVSVFNYEKTMRATLLAIDTGDLKEPAGMIGMSEEAVEVLMDIHKRRLCYMAAEAIKSNPYANALDIMRGLSDSDSFVEWFDRAVDYLEEDHPAEEAEAEGSES